VPTRTRWVPLAVWLVALTLSASAHALTLFIDFNNAQSEIQAFHGGPTVKRNDMVVLPSYERISLVQRLAARRANEALERATLLAQDCAMSVGVKPAACKDVYLRIRAAELERVAATGNYSTAELKAELLDLLEKNSSLRFDMLVISGHHEQGFYRGELSQASELEFIEFMQLGAPLFAKLNTIVLLGCATGVKSAYVKYLSPLFPHAALIVGAEDSAPTRDEARNLAFIRTLVASRRALLQSKTPKEVEPLFRRLLAKNWPVSLLWRHDTLFLKKGAEPF
jgi:hypothetical protein